MALRKKCILYKPVPSALKALEHKHQAAEVSLHKTYWKDSSNMAASDSDNNSDYSDYDDGGYENDLEDLFEDNVDCTKGTETPHPEYFEYELMQEKDTEDFLNKSVEKLCSEVNSSPPSRLTLPPFDAKIILQKQNWNWIEEDVETLKQKKRKSPSRNSEQQVVKRPKL